MSDVINTVDVPQIQYIESGHLGSAFLTRGLCVCVPEAHDVRIELTPWIDRPL